MNNIFRIKRRTSSADAPALSALANGELAFNEVGNVLYYGEANGNAKAIGGEGAFVTLDTAQTITEQKTFVGTVNLGSTATTTTAATNDSSTAVANTAFVKNVASLLDGGSF
jgi:hypothetical protein